MEEIQLAPNPARDQAVLAFTLTQKMQVQISLHRLDGRMLQQWPAPVLAGDSHQQNIDLAGIESGPYLLRITT